MSLLPHIRFAHFLWKNHLTLDAKIIDATVGNGKDTLFLSTLSPYGTIYGFDIQKKAIERTQNLLQQHGKENFTLYHQSHENFSIIPEKIDLFVYNLGYLPGSDHKITTMGRTTVTSLVSALKKLTSDGAISLLCYVGHEKGKEEYIAISSFLQELDPKRWEVSKHQWLYHEKSPILFWLKAASTS